MKEAAQGLSQWTGLEGRRPRRRGPGRPVPLLPGHGPHQQRSVAMLRSSVMSKG